ncbi:sorbose reductase sou1 [Artomyces pyxidatus]|uniref:Sorbose reductase sou1 n=1 Tax=Artomyces pyxidatus TaxID=48021 RepID=A0ACB8SH89_9AGAM|nr:sorbose reductase sou1 [Artomyces pyxidatus]
MSVEPISPLAPLGVAAALAAESNPSITPHPRIWDEFQLSDRVGLVTGANRGLGLEMALVLLEAGARAVYCIDLPAEPGEEWQAVRAYAQRMRSGARLEYVRQDVTDQAAMWEVAQKVADKEGRIDIGIAAAGIASAGKNCLDYPADEFRKALDINATGALFTAQAVGRQMDRLGTPGSIIIVASVAGTITLKDMKTIPYNTSKSALLQLARSMACELGPKRIRVNTVSPGYVCTKMTGLFIESQPSVSAHWSSGNPLGRIATPDEMRGVIIWLSSDASSFCTGSDIIVDGGAHSW